MTEQTLLVIDGDEEILSAEVVRFLQEQDIKISFASGGMEGLKQTSALQPSAVLLSVELPDVSGYSVCAKLRRDPALKHIPIVVGSAVLETQERFAEHQRRKARADFYVNKPYELTDLFAALKESLALEDKDGEIAARDSASTLPAVVAEEPEILTEPEPALIDDLFGGLGLEPEPPAHGASEGSYIHPKTSDLIDMSQIPGRSPTPVVSREPPPTQKPRKMPSSGLLRAGRRARGIPEPKREQDPQLKIKELEEALETKDEEIRSLGLQLRSREDMIHQHEARQMELEQRLVELEEEVVNLRFAGAEPAREQSSKLPQFQAPLPSAEEERRSEEAPDIKPA